LASYEEGNEYDFGAHIKEMRLGGSIERGHKENFCLTHAKSRAMFTSGITLRNQVYRLGAFN